MLLERLEETGCKKTFLLREHSREITITITDNKRSFLFFEKYGQRNLYLPQPIMEKTV